MNKINSPDNEVRSVKSQPKFKIKLKIFQKNINLSSSDDEEGDLRDNEDTESNKNLIVELSPRGRFQRVSLTFFLY